MSDAAKDLFQIIDSLVWKLKSNVVMWLDQPLERKSLDKRGIDSTAIYCNTILHVESYIYIYILKLLNPMDAASVLGDPLETKSQTL